MTKDRFGLRWFGSATVILAAGLLLGLTWIGALGTIRTQRALVVARAESEAANEALVFEEQLRRQLLAIDQTLRILELEWQRDPEHFDISVWSRQLVMIADSSLQLFVADNSGIVRASSRPEIIGTDISGRDYFRHERDLPKDDGRMFISALTRGAVTRQWQLNMVRRLDRDNHKFAGVISASFDPASLAHFYSGIDLGPHGMVAVVGSSDGGLRTVVGPTPGESETSIFGSPLFTALLAQPDGEWEGPSATDGVRRLHAFRHVPDRDLTVLVGIDQNDVVAPAVLWERSALLFAGGISALLLLLTGLLLREIRAARQREAALAEDRATLAQSNAWAQAKTAQLEATFTGMTDGLMVIDADLRLLEWNQHFPDAVGVDPAILRVGLPAEDIIRAQTIAGEFGPVDVETEVARRMALLRTGGSTGTIQRTRPDGRLMELRRNPVAGGGYVTLYTDVTARHQAEERMRQAQTMASIGRLTSGVAHDFNNLLASITGNAEMLHQDLREHPVHGRRIAIIVQAAARGAALVRQLLAFSRKQALAPAQVDLNEAVRNMRELMRTMVGGTIRIETKLEPDLWPALVDPIQIEHVILNLAINARDAMPDGGDLTIATSNEVVEAATQPVSGPGSALNELPAGSYVVVSVIDTGTGIPEDVLRDVFEPFFTTKPAGKGSGLGLSQVYGVASQSGGGVRISSKVGVGTTVQVFIPRANAASGSPPVAVPDAVSEAADTRSQPVPFKPGARRILLVDDDASVRETVAAMLTAHGYVTTNAEDGKSAVRLFEAGARFDLLLVDLAMPEMDGAEVAELARKRQPDIPVVIMTGYRDEDRMGHERWVLMKPFRLIDLEAIMREALAASEPARGLDAASRAE